MRGLALRPATDDDCDDIARILRAAQQSFAWMPTLHTPGEDRAFIRDTVLPNQSVTLAQAGDTLVGFIAAQSEWVHHLYLDPPWRGRGVGSLLLQSATASVPEVRLYCFQANAGARRFYERGGFVAESFGDGAGNEEGLPDVLYVRR